MFNCHKFLFSNFSPNVTSPEVQFDPQPATQFLNTDTSKTFSIGVKTNFGSKWPVSYQWYRLPKGKGNFQSISGATSPTLSLSGLSQQNNAGDFYRCRVQVSRGLDSIWYFSSAAARLEPDTLWEGGIVFSCGSNSSEFEYSLGDGTKLDRSWLVNVFDATFGESDSRSGISKISMGYNHGFVLTNYGKLWGWGNKSQYVGTGQTDVYVSSPVRVGSDLWYDVAAGCGHTLAIKKSDRSLWGWGLTSSSDGRAPVSNSPSLIDSGRWKQVSAGGTTVSGSMVGHSLAIKEDGTLWSWGRNTNGQLGLGDLSNRANPTNVSPSSVWSQVSSGPGYTLAMKSDGTAWGWGARAEKFLGPNGMVTISIINETVPKRIWPNKPSTSGMWRKICAGFSGSIGIDYDGKLWICENWATDPSKWVSYGGDSSSGEYWKDIACGNDSFYAICESPGGQYRQGLWSWGSNLKGQLSNGLLSEICVRGQSGTYICDAVDVPEPKMIDSNNLNWTLLSAGPTGFMACLDDTPPPAA